MGSFILFLGCSLDDWVDYALVTVLVCGDCRDVVVRSIYEKKGPTLNKLQQNIFWF
jgi:hypothetical protein